MDHQERTAVVLMGNNMYRGHKKEQIDNTIQHLPSLPVTPLIAPGNNAYVQVTDSYTHDLAYPNLTHLSQHSTLSTPQTPTGLTSHDTTKWTHQYIASAKSRRRTIPVPKFYTQLSQEEEDMHDVQPTTTPRMQKMNPSDHTMTQETTKICDELQTQPSQTSLSEWDPPSMSKMGPPAPRKRSLFGDVVHRYNTRHTQPTATMTSAPQQPPDDSSQPSQQESSSRQRQRNLKKRRKHKNIHKQNKGKGPSTHTSTHQNTARSLRHP